jgi:glycosyltransferase A (GT-A) superfamily protein (DUF2064 family)
VSNAAIGIICKAPQPGRSKTRLAAAMLRPGRGGQQQAEAQEENQMRAARFAALSRQGAAHVNLLVSWANALTGPGCGQFAR